MKIKTIRRDGLPVIELAGRLEGGEDNLRLLGLIEDLARENELDVVVNLKKVKWISSTGLGILMRVRNRFLEHGGALKLCEVSSRNLSLFAITRTNLLFDVYETESAAIAAKRATEAPG
jgi:anti-sigma B factor antagonist